ncbi:hypothetical protein F4806DRAFT_506843 [Annulohypoxylon nitens]|nr:hypothetical protein F4806DRAFT_506843 [Annulohypoxylon nitens]
MSFGFGVGDFIAGANLAYKLIRVMTETRGATDEFQEALAEVCGIQQIFIQLTQLCRSETLPRPVLNSIAQIIMPSMTTIADFLDKATKYQKKLSPQGGLSSSWCKMGWALFRKDELKLLHDTLHSRLSAINTLLDAARHLPPPAGDVSKYQVHNEVLASQYEHFDKPISPDINLPNPPEHTLGLHEKISVPSEHLDDNFDQTPNETETSVPDYISGLGNDQATLPDMTNLQGGGTTYSTHNEGQRKVTTSMGSINGLPGKVEQAPIPPPPTPKQSKQQNPPPSTPHSSNNESAKIRQILNEVKGKQASDVNQESVLQKLVEKALLFQAEAEAKAEAERKAAKDAEWRQQVEKLIRTQADIDAQKRLEDSRIKAENSSFIRFKDAVGRQFNFPFEACRTWQGIEELIKQAFLHVDVIGPHVMAGHYDLVGPSGEIVLPQLWARVIEPDWSVTMHMWPMDQIQRRNGAQPRPPPQDLRSRPAIQQANPLSNPNSPPALLPQPPSSPRPPSEHQISGSESPLYSDDDLESDHDRKFSFKEYFKKKLKGINGRSSPSSRSSFRSD